MTILLVLVLLTLFAVLHLITVVQRVEKATKRVGRILDRPRKELAALEEELEEIRDLAMHGAADEDDMRRAEAIEEKIARRTGQHR